MRVEEHDLDVVVLGQELEVRDRVAASKTLSGYVVSLGCFVLLVERAEPDALVFFVDLSAPAAIRLGNHAFVL